MCVWDACSCVFILFLQCYTSKSGISIEHENKCNENGESRSFVIASPLLVMMSHAALRPREKLLWTI
jgi:hypothetical protein